MKDVRNTPIPIDCNQFNGIVKCLVFKVKLVDATAVIKRNQKEEKFFKHNLTPGTKKTFSALDSIVFYWMQHVE